MPNRNKSVENDAQKQEEQTSSPGINSPSVTPKDVSPKDASARDETTRKTCSDDLEEREEELLDDAVDMTFPASDPIAIPSPRELRPKH